MTREELAVFVERVLAADTVAACVLTLRRRGDDQWSVSVFLVRDDGGPEEYRA